MSKNSNNMAPPKLMLRFFRWFCNPVYVEDIEGDLLERYEKNRNARKTADWLFVIDVLKLFRPELIKVIYNHKRLNNYAMFKHYLKISWRDLTRQKIFSSIKIGGLSLGVAACLLIGMFIKDEKSYDLHYEDGDQIFRLAKVDKSSAPFDKWTIMQAPVRQVLYETFPEINKVARIVTREWYNSGDNQFRRIENKQSVYEQEFIYADPEILEILEIPLIYGSQKHALKSPKSIVLSKSKADKYFPNEDPIGKQIVLNDDEIILTVGGVMADFPTKSHLQCDFIITLEAVEFWPGEQTSWCCNNYEYYVKLDPGVDKVALEEKLLHIRDTYVVPQLLAEGSVEVEDVKSNRFYYLQPVKNIYLKQDDVHDSSLNHGIKEMIWVLGIIAFVILALAIINFVNLATAKSANRAKEVGLRKVIGSNRSSLISQYLAESTIYSFISIAIGLIITWFALPTFNSIADKSLQFPWYEWWFIPVTLTLTLFIGLVAGIYPAFYLSSFKPMEVMRGKVSQGSKASGFRSGLVIIQFTISITMIVSALIVHEQMEYFLNKELGFEKEQVITIQSAETLGDNQKAFKNELLKQVDIQDVSISHYLPISGTAENNNLFWNDGRKELDQGIHTRIWRVDYDYISTLGMKISDGRNFSKNMPSDGGSIIINKRMAELLNLEEPVGAKVFGNDETRQVIGVVEDFHFGSLADPIGPLCMLLGDYGSNVIIKTNTENIDQTITSITSIWDNFMPHQAIRYGFLDERFAMTYTNKLLKKIEIIFLIFGCLAIVIACLGLFALSTFTVEQRSKEISIRKILGASVKTIIGLLTFNFIKLILIAFIVAAPIGWVFMEWFLEEFTYHIEIGWSYFFIAGITAIVIALVTIGSEAIKAALANPSKRLRAE